MKIVIYAGSGGSGGLRGCYKGFLSACGALPSVRISVICTSEFGQILRPHIAPNVSLIETDASALKLSDYIKGRRMNAEIVEIIEREKPDIIYFMNGVILKGVEKYKLAVGMHNQLFVEKERLKQQRPWKVLLSLLIQRHFTLKSMKEADLVVFESQQSMDQSREKGLRFRQGVVARYGVQEQERREYPVDKPMGDPVELLYVSTILPYKNQEHLIMGLAELKRRGFATRLHLVGSGPAVHIESLKRRIAALDMEENVILYSWVDHSKIRDMIDQSDIFVYASSIETSGFGLMEGMVRGAVIACNNESCMPEILGDGGLLFDVHSAENTADVLQQLIENKNLRMELSRKALEKSAAYTWDQYARVLLSAFRELTN